MPHWDSENVANGMAINRMNTLIETVQKLTFIKVFQNFPLFPNDIFGKQCAYDK